MFLVALPAVASAAQAGANDPSFNTIDDGTFGRGTDGEVMSLARQPDGKLLIGGQFGAFNDVATGRIVRLNVDGSVDGSFFGATASTSDVTAIAIQPDGKILIGGPGMSARRLKVDGSLDATFSPSTFQPERALALQLDGKVILAQQVSV